MASKNLLNKVGFVNGCFDVLHIGHTRLLRFAKDNCDYLIVGIDSDSRVKLLKGNNRPYNTSDVRREMLMSLKAVDEVKIFYDEDSLKNLIKLTKPDIMVVGSDYIDKHVVGGEYAKELIYFERIPGYSSSEIFRHSSNR
jgi:rfaE bifunctional protein nucleotidyltransferase chain/domain